MGYKFNIFYTELENKYQTPQFFLSKSDEEDILIIRFSAGPPYEDIAFKIVAKEWDLHERSGYLSLFEKGILHLYFNFKTFRYRR